MSKNIWDLHGLGGWVGIPTNIGWTKNGYNVMGAGLAFQAKEKYPDLPFQYGKILKNNQERNSTTLVIEIPEYKLLMLPTKPLNEDMPSMSWNAPSSKDLIEKTLEQLGIWLYNHPEENVYIPYLGCGNGGLSISDIKPLIEPYIKQYSNLYIIDKKGR
jgi:hypothetical protein